MVERIVSCCLLFLTFNICSQTNIFTDIYKGGVSVIGSATWNATGTFILPTNISSYESIRKIYLITYSNKHSSYIPFQKELKIDNQLIEINRNNSTEVFVNSNFGLNFNDGHIILVKDISSEISTIGSNLQIDWLPNPTLPPAVCPSCVYAAPLVLILYNNSTMPTMNFSLFLNQKTNQLITETNYNYLNPNNNNYQTAFSIHGDRIGGNNQDGYNFKINNTGAGFCVGQDQPFNQTGVVGCYNFENNALYGLTDDSADSIFSGNTILDGADGLIDINYYINNTLDGFNFNFEYIQMSNIPHNILVSTNLAYSTPCTPINVQTSSDTTICRGANLTLSASGGQTYEWLPQEDLSCYDCENPVFTGDSSQLYTVRIWGNDTCSVVRPIMVKVIQPSKTLSFNQSNTLCGDNNGSVSWLKEDSNQYQIDNGSWQNNGGFNLLSAGNHIITVQNSAGCLFDTLITIESFLTVDADFSYTPTGGDAPLNVQFIENNTNADGFWWEINDVVQSNLFSSYTFTETGTYQVTLFAYQNIVSCVDSTTVNIVITGESSLFIPEAFSPNEDGKNDVFEIVGLENFPKNELTVYNRWGSEVFHQKNYQNNWNGIAETNSFKSKEKLPTGTYYYVLEIGDESWKGFVYLEE